MVYTSSEQRCSEPNLVFEDFKQFALNEIKANEAANEAHDDALFTKLSEKIERPITKKEHKAFTKALEVLEAGNLINYATKLVEDYHSGDEELVRLMLTSVLRIGFTSSSNLCHFALTGQSGTGKSDLISNLATIWPKTRVMALTSISNQVLFYQTIDDSGKTDPTAFSGKVLIVNEANSSQQTESLKALAEASETEAFTRRVTIGGKAKDLVIQGPRCCIVASVSKIKDSQTANRFIQPTIERETDGARVAKARLSSSNDMAEKTISKDVRCKVAAAAYELLLADKSEFNKPTDEAQELVTNISEDLGLKGVGTRRVKQFWSICQCVAASKSYARGERCVKSEDVIEAHKLLEPWI
jgi:energy-coupling factor transporter ATP-binding protein EcfA2